MSREEEIMLNRSIRGIGYFSAGLLLLILFYRSVSNGFFDPLKHLPQNQSIMTLEEDYAVPAPMTGDSAEGERLFKTHCSSCHITHADATGPALTGARERWIKNSSEENFYEWIRNSKKVRDSGDPYANQLFKKWNGTTMPAINLTNAEIDEIFAYVN